MHDQMPVSHKHIPLRPSTLKPLSILQAILLECGLHRRGKPLPQVASSESQCTIVSGSTFNALESACQSTTESDSAAQQCSEFCFPRLSGNEDSSSANRCGHGTVGS